MLTHLEPLEDPSAFADQGLDRETNKARASATVEAADDSLSLKNN